MYDKDKVQLTEIGNLLKPRDQAEFQHWVTRRRHQILTNYYHYLQLNRRNLVRYKNRDESLRLYDQNEETRKREIASKKYD